jgi:hypothetical protein
MTDEERVYGGGPITAERSSDEQSGAEETAAAAYGSETDEPQDTYSPETTTVTETDGAAAAAADPAIESYLEQPPAVSNPYTTGHIEPVRDEPSAAAPTEVRTAVPMTATDYSVRMQAIQVAFIDDPRQAALDADGLLAEVIQSFTAELARQRDALHGASADGAPDTERMRLAVRRSRELIDTLTNLD